MRIDLFNSTASQISGEQSAQQVKAQNAAKSGQPAGEDRATLSSDSTSVGSLVTMALNTPSRQDKVDALRQAVSSGQYQIDPDKIASAMIDEQV